MSSKFEGNLELDPIEWQEIHGFAFPSEYDRFLKYIVDLINAGLVEEIRVDPKYHRGLIYGGRWFSNIESKEIWRLVPPDFPFNGLWEPVDNANYR